MDKLHSTNKINKKSSNFKYYSQIAMIFVTLLLTANVIGDKPLLFGIVILPAGLLLFPMTYLLGDIVTEVYGFAQSRKIIWMGMFCNLFMAFMCNVSIMLPSVTSWKHTEAYAQILGNSSKLMAISVLTYFVGEFVNSYIVAKLKVKMQGRSFWIRGLCGSWVGEGVETSLFITLAFYGSLPNNELLRLAFFYYFFKVMYAICAMPLANYLVKILKKKENIDTYDYQISFNPFNLA